MAMRRTNYSVTERQYREIQRLAKETSLNNSEIVRRAIDDFIAKYNREKADRTKAA